MTEQFVGHERKNFGRQHISRSVHLQCVTLPFPYLRPDLVEAVALGVDFRIPSVFFGLNHDKSHTPLCCFRGYSGECRNCNPWNIGG
jgi:hypothetical protein